MEDFDENVSNVFKHKCLCVFVFVWIKPTCYVDSQWECQTRLPVGQSWEYDSITVIRYYGISVIR